MKKIFVILAISLISVVIIAEDSMPNMQSVNDEIVLKKEQSKGAFFIGGTGEIGYTTAFTFALEPIVGYEFNHRVALGTGIGAIVSAIDRRSVALGLVEPFLRICAWHNQMIFFDLKFTAGLGFNNELQLCQVGVRPSLRVRLTQHFDLAADVGLFGAQCTADDWSPAIGISATSAGLWFIYRF